SSAARFSPISTPLFHQPTQIALKKLEGDVRIPASAFKDGTGLYGIGIVELGGFQRLGLTGIIRIGPSNPQRAAAPTVAASATDLQLRWNAGFGDGALLEISPPGPTLRGSLNT